MSLFRIYREAAGQAFQDTGDTYDDGDVPGALDQHMAELQAGDGVCRSAMAADTPAAASLPPASAPVQDVATQIVPLQFMARLTMPEQLAITAAGQQVPQVQLFLLKLAAAGAVDVTAPDTRAGVDAMVSAGLLTAERGAQLLDLAQASP